MNRVSINSIIANHLKESRRVVVPELGAFVAKESGEIIFSELLRADDGVLMSLLLSRGLSEIEAVGTIDRYKFEVRHALQEFGYCQLDELGTLRLEADTKQLKLYKVENTITSYGSAPSEEEAPAKATVKEVEAPAKATVKEVEAPARATVKEVVAPLRTPSAPKFVRQVELESRPTRIEQSKRRGVDTIMVVAIVILVAAIAVIGYGYYVSHYMTESDDRAIDMLRNEVLDEINQE